MSNSFHYIFRVRYAECDAQNVVFNSRYGDYVDMAITEYQRVIWGSYQNLLAQGLDFQVIHYNITWRAPAKFDDILCASMQLKTVGKTSFTFNVQFSHHQTNQVLADAEIVYVLVDAETYQKTPISDALRTTLHSPMSDLTINHAGEFVASNVIN